MGVRSGVQAPRAGFTLLELVVVIALTTVFLGVATTATRHLVRLNNYAATWMVRIEEATRGLDAMKARIRCAKGTVPGAAERGCREDRLVLEGFDGTIVTYELDRGRLLEIESGPGRSGTRVLATQVADFRLTLEDAPGCRGGLVGLRIRIKRGESSAPPLWLTSWAAVRSSH